jgi:hypothetical protein
MKKAMHWHRFFVSSRQPHLISSQRMPMASTGGLRALSGQSIMGYEAVAAEK